MRRLIIISQKPIEKVSSGLSFHEGVAAALLAAALAYSGHGAALGNLIANHPFLAALFGVGAAKGIQMLAPGKPLVTGEVSLAEPGNPLYNTDWQRRFADAQAHPVTVIKTGADKSHIFEHAMGGIPLLFALEGITQQPVTLFLEHNPYIFNGSLMTKESAAIGQDVSDILTSARRFMKSASLENLEFLEGVPAASRNSVWDLAILNAADKIARKS
jgi:hypothetical protein